MRLLPRILAHTIEHGHHLEESRQLLSYALIHPATSLEDRAALALWLNHLEERAAARGDSLERPPPAGPHHHHHQSTPPSTLTSSGSSSSTNNSSSGNLYSLHHHQRYGSDDRLNGWQSSRDSGLGGGWHQQQQGCENGHLLLYPSSSVPATINTVGTGGGGNTSKLTLLCPLCLIVYLLFNLFLIMQCFKSSVPIDEVSLHSGDTVRHLIVS